MTREEVFVPPTRSSMVKERATAKVVNVEGTDMDELLEDAPLYRLVMLVVQQVSCLRWR